MGVGWGFGARTCSVAIGVARQRYFVGRRVMFWCANDLDCGEGDNDRGTNWGKCLAV